MSGFTLSPAAKKKILVAPQHAVASAAQRWEAKPTRHKMTGHDSVARATKPVSKVH